MPRRLREASGGEIFHVMNRGVGRMKLFFQPSDYHAFITILIDVLQRTQCCLLSMALMPNHWHLLLLPLGDNDLSAFMHLLTLTHTQQWHAYHNTVGTGPIYQGRFKSFPVQKDGHFLKVARYIERNPLRANLVELAEDWKWTSLHLRLNPWLYPDLTLTEFPVQRPENWIQLVNQPESSAELFALRNSTSRGAPFGDCDWQKETAERLGLQSTIRPLGRPRKN